MTNFEALQESINGRGASDFVELVGLLKFLCLEYQDYAKKSPPKCTTNDFITLWLKKKR